ALNRHRDGVNRADPAWHAALAEGVSAVPTPFELLLRGRLREVIEEALRELPESWREVLELVDMQGWSRAAAAKRLGTTENNLKQRLHRARKGLEEILEGRGLSSIDDL
ncbi:MAG: sigma-70 family RNA polymerase sigma factor, partial [Longimicrobiales bacterium]|nr:sigma-70 family RNA polymerase sigma factor [Longimicrobiales bacterium]